MIVRYQDGTALEGVTLARTDRTLRVGVKDRQDVLHFAQTASGGWVSEYCEPVSIEFETRRMARAEAASEDDFLCPTELATHLIDLLSYPDRTSW
jgi:hypothetical protein